MDYETPIMEVTFFGGNVRTVVDYSNIEKDDNNAGFTGPEF